ncbi:hypothetical protein UPYG_G00242670 [Umbra pygmaea]|uniref:Uncharacterized protein n=1 Tax=Umbra pygmaea TaxID=75934 RepID=A0ABD0X659_UMBPY
MEFVSGYRDRIVEFSDAMAQWYRCFQTARSCHKEAHDVLRGGGVLHYPVDGSPYWILHLLDCATPPPAAISRLEQARVETAELSWQLLFVCLSVSDW